MKGSKMEPDTTTPENVALALGTLNVRLAKEYGAHIMPSPRGEILDDINAGMEGKICIRLIGRTNAIEKIAAIIQGIYSEANIDSQGSVLIERGEKPDKYATALIDVSPFLENPVMLRDALSIGKWRKYIKVGLGAVSTLSGMTMELDSLAGKNKQAWLTLTEQIIGLIATTAGVSTMRNVALSIPTHYEKTNIAASMIDKVRGFYDNKGSRFCELHGIDMQSEAQRSM